MKFEDLGLSEGVLEALSYTGFEKPTPIQSLAIPEVLAGKDILGSAQTGTGKTGAFLLPVLSSLSESAQIKGTSCLIIVPTRELAVQIDQQIQGFSFFTNLSSIALFGGGKGDDWNQQKTALEEGVDIIVTTPGKFISHMNMKNTRLDNLKFLVLDEADRMLDIGFADDLDKIVKKLPKKRQTLMFSATMPKKIRDLARNILHQPKEINISISKPAEGVLQGVYLTYDYQKIPLISHLIKDKPQYKSIIIFSSTKKNVDNIVRALRKDGMNTAGISSDLEQSERLKVLREFRARKVRVLVATDVISRGIDIKDINLVINYDAPSDAEDYVHRVGRTARAETTGVAITFVNENDMYKLDKIERLIESKITQAPLPPQLGEGPERTTLRKKSSGNSPHRNRRNNNRNFRKKPKRKIQNSSRNKR